MRATSSALGLHGLGHAGVERDDRHLKLRADFVDVGFRAKVGDEGHVAALFLKAPGAFKSGDLAVTEGDALRRSVLAQLKFVLDELDGAGRFGCGAEDGGLDERGDDGVDAGHEADLQDPNTLRLEDGLAKSVSHESHLQKGGFYAFSKY